MRVGKCRGMVAVAVVVAVATGLWLAERPGTGEAGGEQPREVPAGLRDRARVGSSGETDEIGEFARPVAGMRRPGSAPVEPRERDRLSIGPGFHQQAEKRAEDLEQGMDRSLAMIGDSEYVSRSLGANDPSTTLALRLGLEGELAREVAGLFAGAREAEATRRIDFERDRLERVRGLLEQDRENYVDFLALEMMDGRGIPLSGSQRDFYDDYRNKVGPERPPAASAGGQEWYEDEELMRELDSILPEETRGELAGFVQERIDREQEREAARATMRSAAIADRLGLSAEERGILDTYLQENPGAGTAEISEMVAPELRDLLVPGM